MKKLLIGLLIVFSTTISFADTIPLAKKDYLNLIIGNRCLSSKLSPKLNLFFCSNFL
jgi:hypothetical protein